jgi:hypothetical protein
MTPVFGDISPILSPLFSVNHRFPSRPEVIWIGAPVTVVIRYSVTTPAVVILPMFPAVDSVNQRLPSGPLLILKGVLEGLIIGYSVTTPVAVAM